MPGLLTPDELKVRVAEAAAQSDVFALWCVGLEIEKTPEALNAQHEGDKTPLHYAVAGSGSMAERKEVIEFLLEKGARTNKRDAEGKSPVERARTLGLEDAFKRPGSFGERAARPHNINTNVRHIGY